MKPKHMGGIGTKDSNLMIVAYLDGTLPFVLPHILFDQILSIALPINTSGEKDEIFWNQTSYGNFTLKLAYNTLIKV